MSESDWVSSLAHAFKKAGSATLQGVRQTTAGDGRNLRVTQRPEEPEIWVTCIPPFNHREGGQALVTNAQLLRGGISDETGQPISADRKLALRISRPAGSREGLRRATIVSVGELPHSEYPGLMPVYASIRARVPDHWPDPDLAGQPIDCDLMPWCEETLRTHLARSGAVGVAGIDHWILMAQTMARLHDNKGLIHRDIDEGNILLGPGGCLWLADLGIVSVVDELRSSHLTRIMGKGFNIPPEARGTPNDMVEVCPSYDAWHLGRVLYMLLTGDPARSPSVNTGSEIETNTREQWNRWKDIRNPEHRDVAWRLVDPDPQIRLSLAEAIQRLAAEQASRGISAPQNPVTIPTTPLAPDEQVTIPVDHVETIPVDYGPTIPVDHVETTPVQSPSASSVRERPTKSAMPKDRRAGARSIKEVVGLSLLLLVWWSIPTLMLSAGLGTVTRVARGEPQSVPDGLSLTDTRTETMFDGLAYVASAAFFLFFLGLFLRHLLEDARGFKDYPRASKFTAQVVVPLLLACVVPLLLAWAAVGMVE